MISAAGGWKLSKEDYGGLNARPAGGKQSVRRRIPKPVKFVLSGGIVESWGLEYKRNRS